MELFEHMPAAVTDALILEAIVLQGCIESDTELCIWFEQPESQLPIFTEALTRLNA